MDIKNFRTGTYKQQYEYKSFTPEKINHEWIVSDPRVNKLLAEANLKLGELNAFGQLVPDLDYFIRMHVTLEATTSSRIEGTQTTMEEALVEAMDIEPEKRLDWLEVRNYVEAMNAAIASMRKLPLSNRLLRQTHKILLSGARGKHKQPGEFRKSQNWIGPTLKDARFVPPTHVELTDLMSDLEKFLHNDSLLVPHLIKIAIAHYQFETIHPFLDGNGRLGRLLITLYLVSTGILKRPTLYLSDYFDRHREYYYLYLSEARRKNDMTQWIRFFLSGVIETSTNSIQTFNSILAMKAKIEQKKIPTLGKRAPKAHDLLKKLYTNPIITSGEVQSALGITAATANALIADFVRIGMLEEMTGQKRNRVFAFEEYVGIFRRKEV